ncbi:MAG: N-acetylmuramidase family protein [Caldilineales bacterium]|nr:N-acetylmuramidase family protein [Caldilineales bacterium]
MNRNKLGFYIQVSKGVHDRITAIKPPVILMHAWDQGLLEEIRRFRSPDSFVIGRMDYVRIDGKQTPVADLVKGWLTEGDPEAHGRFFAEHILEDNFRLAQRAEGGRRLVDAWMSLNECVPGPASKEYRDDRAGVEARLRAYDRFQFGFRNKLMEQGVEAVAFNFAAGNFGAAEHYSDFFPLSLSTYTYLGFHEYGWPALSQELHPDAASSAGTYGPIVRRLAETQGRDYRVIITEAGLARMYKYQVDPPGDVGWLYPGEAINQESYRRSLEWYNERLNRDDFVLGACLFQVGHGGKWETFRHIGLDNEGRPIAILDWIQGMAESSRGAGDRGVENTMADMIGIDANSPIHDDGNLAGQVADPGFIADARVGWVRLNFKLGPWQSVHDQTRHAGRTWRETFTGLVDGYRRRGLQIYGLINHEAVRVPEYDILKLFRSEPGASRSHPWIDRYVETFIAILEMFGNSLSAVESFNEPDGWWGGDKNLVHPGWFAIMLERIYHEVRRRPEFNHIRIVSGPVEGTAANKNGGALHYLPDVYAFGKRHLDWGKPGKPFPFDGIGYHLYVEEGMNRDWLPHREAIRATYTRYLDEMRKTIRASGDSPNKPLYISEMGWYTNHGPEQRQAECLPFALETLLNGGWNVNLAVIFCTQDFNAQDADPPKWYGLYRPGALGENGRKPAFDDVRSLSLRTRGGTTPAPSGPGPTGGTPVLSELGGVTNQDVINAFDKVIRASNLSGWKLMAENGLTLGALAKVAGEPYRGPHPAAMPSLSDNQRAMLIDLLTRAGAGTRGAGSGFLIGLPSLTGGIEQLPPEFQISLRLAANPIERKVARVWNRWSGLLAGIAGELEISLAAATAALALSARHPATDHDGRLTIRFEVQDFLGRSQAAPDALAHYFRTDPARPWQKQYWRADAEAGWRKVHASQTEEWSALRQARRLESEAAYEATGMGIAGIMGFNHDLLGYASAEQMFLSLASSQRMQVLGLFDFIATPGRNSQALRALRRHDFETFAALLAGPGAAARRAAEMAAAAGFLVRVAPVAAR